MQKLLPQKLLNFSISESSSFGPELVPVVEQAGLQTSLLSYRDKLESLKFECHMKDAGSFLPIFNRGKSFNKSYRVKQILDKTSP